MLRILLRLLFVNSPLLGTVTEAKLRSPTLALGGLPGAGQRPGLGCAEAAPGRVGGAGQGQLQVSFSGPKETPICDISIYIYVYTYMYIYI